MKFQKPKDPTNINPSHRNPQKQKMEPVYSDEVHNPKYLVNFKLKLL
jgi:hypothetical protein